jgi:hypothetical protein
MPDYLRIDRFIESAIHNFAHWIRDSAWLGKEHDCVHIIASRFILPSIRPTSPISDYSQIRIE